MSPPTYPLRPKNGGPLPVALLDGPSTLNSPTLNPARAYEPKVNGWRALVHCPTGTMFNRHLEPLSIAHEFKEVLDQLKTWWIDAAHIGDPAFRIPHPAMEWLDCEAFSRRHALGKGSLVLLDTLGVPPSGGFTYNQRQQLLYDHLIADGTPGIAKPWPFLHEPPPENALLSFSYHFTDYGIPCPWSADLPIGSAGGPKADQEIGVPFPGEDLDGIWCNWLALQRANKVLGAELFEGMVSKRLDSPYPHQLLNPKSETPHWIKHRWQW